MIRISFVCLGNICRSPTAEGVMRRLIADAGLDERIRIDSAGTGSWHVGEPPDPRAREEAKRRGYALGGVARQFQPSDFARADYVIAMDTANRRALEAMAPDDGARAKIHLLRDFDPEAPRGAEVPDPYYEDGFDLVFEIVERACRGLLEQLRREHGLGS
ncbi:MAG: low molecular weight protein-tyrosine-phosphatase [Myxococcota bacterium]